MNIEEPLAGLLNLTKEGTIGELTEVGEIELYRFLQSRSAETKAVVNSMLINAGYLPYTFIKFNESDAHYMKDVGGLFVPFIRNKPFAEVLDIVKKNACDVDVPIIIHYINKGMTKCATMAVDKQRPFIQNMLKLLNQVNESVQYTPGSLTLMQSVTQLVSSLRSAIIAINRGIALPDTRVNLWPYLQGNESWYSPSILEDYSSNEPTEQAVEVVVEKKKVDEIFTPAPAMTVKEIVEENTDNSNLMDTLIGSTVIAEESKVAEPKEPVLEKVPTKAVVVDTVKMQDAKVLEKPYAEAIIEKPVENNVSFYKPIMLISCMANCPVLSALDLPIVKGVIKYVCDNNNVSYYYSAGKYNNTGDVQVLELFNANYDIIKQSIETINQPIICNDIRLFDFFLGMFLRENWLVIRS